MTNHSNAYAACVHSWPSITITKKNKFNKQPTADELNNIRMFWLWVKGLTNCAIVWLRNTQSPQTKIIIVICTRTETVFHKWSHSKFRKYENRLFVCGICVRARKRWNEIIQRSMALVRIWLRRNRQKMTKSADSNTLFRERKWIWLPRMARVQIKKRNRIATPHFIGRKDMFGVCVNTSSYNIIFWLQFFLLIWTIEWIADAGINCWWNDSKTNEFECEDKHTCGHCACTAIGDLRVA